MYAEYLENMTEQEVFNKISGHLLQQGEKCIVENARNGIGIYAYRNGQGQSCAAGCLLSKLSTEEIAALENIRWAVLAAENIVPNIHIRLIMKLQYIHDRIMPSMWPNLSYQLGEDFQLDKTLIMEYYDAKA